MRVMLRISVSLAMSGGNGAYGAARCTIRMAAKDFVKMVESGTNPRQLVFFGKMKIDGDMGLAMKLSKFAEMFKNRN